MLYYFDPAYFDPDYFDTPDQGGPTGFIPRGSGAGIEVPDRASASVTVPDYSATITVPDRATGEIE